MLTLAQARVMRGESGFTSFDPAFERVTAARSLHHLVDLDAHEGPVWADDEQALYLTTVPRDGDSRIVRVGVSFPDGVPVAEGVSTVRAATTMANGMTLGADGRLVVCEQGDMAHPARISTVDRFTGDVRTLVRAWHDLPLNSPNDVAIHPDGSVWFTDPSYGHLQGFRPAPRTGDHVYRYDTLRGVLDVVDDSFDKPNGLAFSPDGTVLYVTDSGANQERGSFHVSRPHHVVAFDVDGRRLANRRLVAVTTPGIPDGLKTDPAGRLYVSSDAGVLVYSADGQLLGRVDVLGAVNFTFGGPGRTVLFITADTAVWAAVLDFQGNLT